MRVERCAIRAYFRPLIQERGARSLGCLACDFFRGEYYGAGLVRERWKPTRKVVGDSTGCAYWLRAIGADDSLDE